MALHLHARVKSVSLKWEIISLSESTVTFTGILFVHDYDDDDHDDHNLEMSNDF